MKNPDSRPGIPSSGSKKTRAKSPSPQVRGDTRGRIALIGAGFAGLGMARALKKRGIEFDHFEKENAVGGNWRHGVYDTAHIISSRKTTEYGDFPMPEHYPDFPSAKQMADYLDSYADHFRLRETILFNTEVADAAPEGDAWRVTLASGREFMYDGVIVANGHHWDCRFPEYPGDFTGKWMHSKQYKNPSVLKNKRVLVIGGGNSACDVAVEAARFARESHISLRRGYWFMPKTVFGAPTVELMKAWMPPWLLRLITRLMLRVVVGDYRKYGLQKPDHRPFDKHPTINSQLLYFLKHGTITPHGDVARFEGRDVIFQNGERKTFDVVICGTGFHVSFPFLRPGVLSYTNGMPDLVGGAIPLGRRNLFLFGLGQPRYGAGPLITAGAELVCDAVETQRRMDMPIGDVLRKLGQPLVRSWVMDPFAVLRRIRMGRRIMPFLPRLARFYARKTKPKGSEKLPVAAPSAGS